MNQLIANEIRDHLKTLDLFERFAGLVVPVTVPIMVKGKKTGEQTFPISCDVDGQQCYEQGRHFELLPNSKYKSVCFFEEQTGSDYLGPKDGSKGEILLFQSTLRLIGWLNWKQLGEADCSKTVNVVLTIFNRLTEETSELAFGGGSIDVQNPDFVNARIDVNPETEVIRSRGLFSNYSYERVIDNFRYPYDYFGVDLLCTLQVGKKCFQPTVAQPPIEC